MKTYMQTAVCCQATNVLVLELKHFERLFVKRRPNASVLNSIKAGVELRLETRIARMHDVHRRIPLFGRLLDVTSQRRRDVDEATARRDLERRRRRLLQQQQIRSEAMADRRTVAAAAAAAAPVAAESHAEIIGDRRTSASAVQRVFVVGESHRSNVFGSVAIGGGADGSGGVESTSGDNKPGARSRSGRRQILEDVSVDGGGAKTRGRFGPPEALTLDELRSKSVALQRQRNWFNRPDEKTSDGTLTQLETRMRSWLTSIGVSSGNYWTEPRIEKMKRSEPNPVGCSAENLRGRSIVVEPIRLFSGWLLD